MAKTFPVRVTWRDADGKLRTKGFHLIPRAQAFTKGLAEDGLHGTVWVQDELFSVVTPDKTSTYRPGDDIPF